MSYLQDIARITLAEGGGTFDLWRAPLMNQPVVGWAVGLRNGVRVDLGCASADQEVVADDLAQEIGEFIALNIHRLARPLRYLGTWSFKGQVSIDIVEQVGHQDRALALGRAEGQEAIYNLGTKVTIFCKTGTEEEG